MDVCFFRVHFSIPVSLVLAFRSGCEAYALYSRGVQVESRSEHSSTWTAAIFAQFRRAGFFPCPFRFHIHWSFCHSIYSAYSLRQGCTNTGHQVAVATKFYTVVPHICGSSVWNLLHVTLLTPRSLRGFLNFWKICASII